MEVQIVHTTGSPSRHDSDSESSYDRSRQMKSSSEVALHRKQSRRCKKQMSERQRRKKMNNFMDKLGALVYGDAFQDGRKVDKATLLKDAYEKLQTTSEDYSKGYETAITCTQSFLDSFHPCPPEVKDALKGHLKNILKVNHHKCHSALSSIQAAAASSSSSPLSSTAAGVVGMAMAGPDCSSDSCSPQPGLRPPSSSAAERLDDLPGSYPSDPAPRFHRVPPVSAAPASHGQGGVSGSSREVTLSSVRCFADLNDPHISSTDFHPAKTRASPAVSTATRTVAQVAPLPVKKEAVSMATEEDSLQSLKSRALSSYRASSGLPADAAAASFSQAVWPYADLSPARSDSRSPFPKDLRPVRKDAPHPYGSPFPAGYPFFPFHPTALPISSPSPQPPSATQFHLGTALPPSPSCQTSPPKISPYVTPFAPQKPLYLGSSPSGMLYGVPDLSYPGPRSLSSRKHPTGPPGYPAPAHPLSAHTPTPSRHPAAPHPRADDSGYVSPGMPTPHSHPHPWTRTASHTDGAKKRQLFGDGVGLGQPGDSDGENDREVERVFSGREDSAPSQSD